MVATVVLILFFLLLIALLWVPMEMYINTVKNQYYLQLRGLARASVEGHEEELLRIRLRVLFRNFYFYPLRKIAATPSKKLKKKGMRKKKPRKPIPFQKILRILKSFQVKRLWVDIDTGNCMTNAKLYPAFSFLNYHTGGFHINFEGRTNMVLLLRNRPINIITSFINF